MNSKILISMSILILLFSGCTQPDPKQILLDDSKATPQGVKELVNSNNQFALEMYSEINEEEKNLFFSPWSISSALAMTFEGAKGETKEEMQQVLHFQENDLDRRSSFASFYNTINTENKEYQLSTANALWAQKDYPFLEEYLKVNKQYYSAKVTNLDFKTKTEESRQTINKWVEEQTNNKIKNLIPQGNIDPLTRLVLTNAIYFKGNWAIQFDKTKTKKEDFKVNETKTVQADMMSLKKGKEKFNYGENEQLQIIELPYKGEKLSMLVFLPKESNLQEIEKELNSEKLSEWKKLLTKKEVYVFMPKFKFETKYFMVDTLTKIGMPSAFSGSGNADFSGMDGTKNLYISDVIHQAFVEVNEEGTEAAAATAVGMELKSSGDPREIPEFRANHPFIFIIQENSTGSILFMGKVTDPTA